MVGPKARSDRRPLALGDTRNPGSNRGFSFIMKHFYYKDDLSIWDRRTNEKIGGATTLENALLITDALNDEYLLREKVRLQGNGREQRS